MQIVTIFDVVHIQGYNNLFSTFYLRLFCKISDEITE